MSVESVLQHRYNLAVKKNKTVKEAAPHRNIGFLEIKLNDVIHLFILGYEYMLLKPISGNKV